MQVVVSDVAASVDEGPDLVLTSLRARQDLLRKGRHDLGRASRLPPGCPPDPRDVWDPVGDYARHCAEPVCYRGDGGNPERRPRSGTLGLLGDHAEEPDERRHRGRCNQHRPDLLRWSGRPDRRRRRDPRRDPRRGKAVSPLVPPRLSHPNPPAHPTPPRGPFPFFVVLSSIRWVHVRTPATADTPKSPPNR